LSFGYRSDIIHSAFLLNLCLFYFTTPTTSLPKSRLVSPESKLSDAAESPFHRDKSPSNYTGAPFPTEASNIFVGYVDSVILFTYYMRNDKDCVLWLFSVRDFQEILPRLSTGMSKKIIFKSKVLLIPLHHQRCSPRNKELILIEVFIVNLAIAFIWESLQNARLARSPANIFEREHGFENMRYRL